MAEIDETLLHERSVSAESEPVTHLDVLYHWRRFIIINVLVVAIVTAGISFLLPNWYRATASILPPKGPDMLNMFGSAGSVLKNLGSLSKLGGLNQSSGQYNYFAILKSRSTLEEIVRRFNLINVYDIPDTSMEDAVKQLRKNASFESQEDDNINIEVMDKNPERAAAMANAFVELLNKKSLDLAVQEAQNNRLFIEQRVQLTKDSLRHAEEALTAYQERSGMMITPEQTASATAIADLYAMKARKEIEVAILRRTVTPDNQALHESEMELSEMQRKLDSIPGVGLKTVRLYRDMMISQKILEFLLPIYEQAKIDEQKNVPVLLVLDKAVPPQRKAWPQRSLIILSVVMLFLLFSLVLVYLMQGIARRGSQSTQFQRIVHFRVMQIMRTYRIPVGIR